MGVTNCANESTEERFGDEKSEREPEAEDPMLT